MKISVFWGKLKLPFRWLFAKRWRWIPVAAILAAFIILVITVYSVKLYNHIIWQLDENEYQRNEELRIEEFKTDFENSRQAWISSNITSYSLKLTVYVDGESYWEESHGRSSGQEKVISLKITVENNKISELQQASTGGVYTDMNPDDNIYYKSMSDIFNTIQDALDGKISDDVLTILKVHEPDMFSEKSSLTPPGDPIPIKVRAYFHCTLGYPIYVTIYFTVGNHDYYYTRGLISYEIPIMNIIVD
jgi:hypothetical protein